MRRTKAPRNGNMPNHIHQFICNWHLAYFEKYILPEEPLSKADKLLAAEIKRQYERNGKLSQADIDSLIRINYHREGKKFRRSQE